MDLEQLTRGDVVSSAQLTAAARRRFRGRARISHQSLLVAQGLPDYRPARRRRRGAPPRAGNAC
ncbi:MAG: hypothetical protein HOQ21_15205 [Dermatophilaceae bacterium]|nr:hypothetical protein [Dermatophilaceae bacterium]